MYLPILKGKQGEFDAWKNISPSRRGQIQPLFEIVSDKGATQDLIKFRDGLLKASLSNDVLAIDFGRLGVGAVESSTGLAPYAWLHQELSDSNIEFQPVVHLGDSEEQVRDATEVAGKRGLLLRIGGMELDPAPASMDTSLHDWCADHALRTEDVDLLIDLGSIHGLDPLSVSDMATAYLSWATNNGPWASMILSSGAFPQQISNMRKGIYNFVERADAALWQRMQNSTAIELRYSDHASRHPDLVEGQMWNGPLPNLRYATGSHWIIWREGKDEQQGFSTFYDVCENIVAHPEFLGAGFSWADETIESKAQRNPGPGAGQQWITLGLSHHIELVADRLSRLGVA